MGRLHVKFHEDRCKGEAVMRLKPFYLTAQFLHCDLDLWPFDPKVHRAHTWLMGRLHVKFHEDRCKGEAFIRLKPFYLTARLQTDGQTDGQTDRQTDRRTDGRTGWFQYTPPNFVAGGINITKIQHGSKELWPGQDANKCMHRATSLYTLSQNVRGERWGWDNVINMPMILLVHLWCNTYD